MKGNAFKSARDFVHNLDKREYKTKFYRIFPAIAFLLDGASSAQQF